jgi:hypothetical protein
MNLIKISRDLPAVEMGRIVVRVVVVVVVVVGKPRLWGGWNIKL